MPRIKQINIYDMDGTIVCSRHRYATITENGNTRIDLEHWRANEHRAYDDSLLPLAQQYQEDLNNPEVFVIIATARVLGDADRKFINDKLGNPDYIVSRDSGNTTSGGLLKIKGLQRIFNLIQFRNVKAVFFEDNATYLKTVCDHFAERMTGVYIPSKQGH